MTAHNLEIAKKLNELADLLEIKGENPFRIRAYRNAARMVESSGKEFAEMVAEGRDLTTIPGIGDHIAEKITAIVKTNHLPQLERLQKKMPAVLTMLLQIQGMGPKRVKMLYDHLYIKNLAELQQALQTGKVEKLPGFGAKTVERIQAGIAQLATSTVRYKLADVMTVAQGLEKYLKRNALVETAVVAGSFRRCKETIGDLDILVIASQSDAVMNHFVRYDEITEIIAKGPTRSTVKLHSGIQVDLRVVPQISYGAALLYFTGSKAHNIALRHIAISKKYKLNEYGLFRGEKRIASKTETEIYQKLGLEFIPPELREDHGEIEAARKHQLPTLIRLTDLRGDLHCHTNATDGNHSIEAMAQAAQANGLEYLAITDHSQKLAFTHGLTKKTLLQQIKKIEQLNAKFKKFRLLKGVEVDILEDGNLDLPDEVLRELDFTVCAVHSKFNLSRKKQTERILRAMDNPYFTILAHPTGRLIEKRKAYDVDLERIMEAAKQRHCILEINSQPERLDLDDAQCQLAKSIGVKLVISSDAHSIDQLADLQYGVFQARRGWLTADDVVNTQSYAALLKDFKR